MTSNPIPNPNPNHNHNLNPNQYNPTDTCITIKSQDIITNTSPNQSPNRLLSLCFGYTLTGANEYWLLNWLKMYYSIELPIFAALLQNASWPLQIIYYKQVCTQLNKTNKPRMITSTMYKSYIILGCLSSFITLTRTIGLTSLPPTIYVIVANTEIIFETLMTRFVLKKTISIYINYLLYV